MGGEKVAESSMGRDGGHVQIDGKGIEQSFNGVWGTGVSNQKVPVAKKDSPRTPQG